MNAVWISMGLQAEYEKENEKPSRGRKIQKQHFAMHFYTLSPRLRCSNPSAEFIMLLYLLAIQCTCRNDTSGQRMISTAWVMFPVNSVPSKRLSIKL